jgi:hypothetical protein
MRTYDTRDASERAKGKYSRHAYGIYVLCDLETATTGIVLLARIPLLRCFAMIQDSLSHHLGNIYRDQIRGSAHVAVKKTNIPSH